MQTLGNAELTIQDRGILASSASAAYLDYFSKQERVVFSTFQQPVLISRKRNYYSRGQTFQIEWQDYGQPLPGWFDPLMQGFVDLRTLPPNWDSYGASPIDAALVQHAMSLINEILAPTNPAPRVVPLSSGGLQLEWHRQGIDLEVVCDLNDQPFFYYRNRASGEELEYALPADNVRLKAIINTFE